SITELLKITSTLQSSNPTRFVASPAIGLIFSCRCSSAVRFRVRISTSLRLCQPRFSQKAFVPPTSRTRKGRDRLLVSASNLRNRFARSLLANERALSLSASARNMPARLLVWLQLLRCHANDGLIQTTVVE